MSREIDHPVDLCKEGVIYSHSDIFTGVPLLSSLPSNYSPSMDQLISMSFDSKTTPSRITAIIGGSSCFLGGGSDLCENVWWRMLPGAEGGKYCWYWWWLYSERIEYLAGHLCSINIDSMLLGVNFYSMLGKDSAEPVDTRTSSGRKICKLYWIIVGVSWCLVLVLRRRVFHWRWCSFAVVIPHKGRKRREAKGESLKSHTPAAGGTCSPCASMQALESWVQ